MLGSADSGFALSHHALSHSVAAGALGEVQSVCRWGSEAEQDGISPDTTVKASDGQHPARAWARCLKFLRFEYPQAK
jgi:hypothetical protein